MDGLPGTVSADSDRRRVSAVDIGPCVACLWPTLRMNSMTACVKRNEHRDSGDVNATAEASGTSLKLQRQVPLHDVGDDLWWLQFVHFL